MKNEELVENQVKALNEKKRKEFEKCFNDDFQLFDSNGKLIIFGKKKLMEVFEVRFLQKGFRCQVIKRFILKNGIIDKEQLWLDNKLEKEVIVFYQFEDNKIKCARYLK